MPRILQLLIQSIRRKQAAAQAFSTATGPSSSPASSSASVQPVGSDCPQSCCPCSPSVRTRVASWTFSFAGAVPAAAAEFGLSRSIPFEPTQSVALQSAHTKLHLYDLCACKLEQHSHILQEGHAFTVAAAFGAERAQEACAVTPAVAAASASLHLAAVPPAVASVDLSAIPWGHALNTLE
jgi:hypothetical protein